jgi:CubicO group peptidase (beta-lactamase class C family)
MRAHHVHGLSVAVIDGYRVVWAKAYGLADAEQRTPVEATTLFQAGSISKPVAATAILKRVEEGKLALDRPIDLALTSWKLPENHLTRKAPVTLAMLLSHTAGLTVHGFPGYAVGDPVPTVPQILDGVPPANTAPVRVAWVPGSKFEYSGGGYTIAQLALVDTDHRPFPAIVADTVLGLLDMDHSTYEQPLPLEKLAHAAVGYDATGEPIPGKRHTYPEMAAAGLWTTPSDLAKFGVEIALASKGKSSRVLSPATAARMLTKVAEVAPRVDVGLGLFLEHRGAVTYFGHDGADEGFQAKLVMQADRGCGVAMMANSDNGLPLMDEMLRAVAAEYAWEGYSPEIEPAKLAPARLAELAGAYQAHGDRVYRVTVENDHLVVRTPFLESGELVAVNDSEFLRADDETRYVFTKGADGAIALEMTPSPGPGASKRVPDSLTVPMDDLAAGRLDQAVARYRAALAKEPDEAAWAEARFEEIAYQLLARGDVANAILVFRLGVALRPDSMRARHHVAATYARAGDHDHAAAAYRDVLACAARDTKLGAGAKDALRRKALAKLKDLGSAP